jgi:mono/diheme cytochrome c family protein
VFGAECTTCHGADGTSDVGPALAGNTSMAVRDFVIKRLLLGVADMPSFASSLTDRQIAAVGTFVRNSWDNAHGIVPEADVKRVRAEVARGAK